MVSTRGAKFKFTEGEKVLCYEPDPTKAKVLYDSKVLEVCVSKDNKGRKLLEYLIHFSGWSNTWDRCVTEEYILKDNEENRALQTRLSEIAAIHLKTKKKKRRLSDVLKDSSSKRKCSDAEPDDWKGSGDSNGSHSTTSSVGERSEDEEEQEESTSLDLNIPDILKKKLEDDHNAIKSKKKLVKLPYEPNVVTILEGYVKNYAANLLCATPEKPTVTKISAQSERNINLCKEVMDGLRIYFDFTLPVILLFNEEREQHLHAAKSYRPSLKHAEVSDESDMRTPTQSTSKQQIAERDTKSPSEQSVHTTLTATDTATASRTIKIEPKDHPHSPLSHKHESLGSVAPKSPAHRSQIKKERSEETTEMECPRRVLRSSRAHEAPAPTKLTPTVNPEVALSTLTEAEPRPSTPASTPVSGRERRPSARNARACALGRQTTLFASRSSSVSGESASPPPMHHAGASPLHAVADACLPPPPTLQIPGHVSSQSSSSSRSGPSTPTAGATGRSSQRHVMNTLNDTLSWNMIPSYVYQQSPPPPSLLYGAQHLLRLFVKLPELIKRANIPGKKLDMLLIHLDLFLKYLEQGGEDFFPSSAYVDVSSVETEVGCPGLSTNNDVIQR